MRPQVIAIAGNIGVGKSSLAALLAARQGWRLLEEPAAENPYLADFYEDMARWGFHSQLFFLTHRLRQYARAHQVSHTTTVQDRSLYEDAEVFAATLHSQGAISARDWETYCALYEAVVDVLPPPDLLVYLRAGLETLRARIRRRGRDFEQEIDQHDYLARLNERYERWASGFRRCPMLVIESDTLDFVQHAPDLEAIEARIVAALDLPLADYRSITKR
jgi:deoxyadenosine/deoxycytidine kinase